MIVVEKGLGLSATHRKSTNLQSQCSTCFVDVGLLALLLKKKSSCSNRKEG